MNKQSPEEKAVAYLDKNSDRDYAWRNAMQCYYLSSYEEYWLAVANYIKEYGNRKEEETKKGRTEASSNIS